MKGGFFGFGLIIILLIIVGLLIAGFGASGVLTGMKAGWQVLFG